jgi:serine/threonine protein kinase
MKETLIGTRYLLLESIGSGGEARVFRARDMTTGNEVALRMGHKPGSISAPDQMPAFHAGWVQLLDSNSDPQYGVYQIFELLEGKTLHQLVQQSSLDPENWLLFVNQSLDAVGALHIAGWIHGDLNAENFLYSSSRWKLLELPFLHFDPEEDRTNLFGSIYTLAPERLDGAKPDARSDLYALGCLYYYAASGEWPHAGASSQEIAIDHLRFAPVPLAEKAPHLFASWSTWVMTLLEREPQNRFSTVSTAHQLLKVA